MPPTFDIDQPTGKPVCRFCTACWLPIEPVFACTCPGKIAVLYPGLQALRAKAQAGGYGADRMAWEDRHIMFLVWLYEHDAFTPTTAVNAPDVDAGPEEDWLAQIL